MILYVLFGQRECDYEEQYAPEALETCDEFTMDENPEWMERKAREVSENGEYSSHAIVEIGISKDGMLTIRDRLNKNVMVSGTVK